MFSYFKGGIKKTICTHVVELPELISNIIDNPQRETINEIRRRRTKGDLSYKELKKKLNYITPNCVVHRRKLKGINFEKNFIKISGFIYFDLDVDSNADQLKAGFIEKYGHSGGGISVLFKINNSITKDNFESVWWHIRYSILKDEKVDIKTKDIGRAMFLSSDPYVFYNPNNSITISEEDITETSQKIKKCVTQRISSININNTLSYAFNLIPIKQVLQILNTSTPVAHVNSILDIIPVDYTDVRFPRVIRDGIKHQLFTVMIHRLVFLNKELPIDYTYSYLNFINQKFAQQPMLQTEFDSLFSFVYSITQHPDYDFKNERIKNFHFNPKSGLSGDQKRDLANKLNGKLKINKSVEKIIEAKKYLVSAGQKITKTNIEKITGLSRKTIITHFNSERNNIDEMVEMYNDSIDVNDYSENIDPNMEIESIIKLHRQAC